MALPESSTVLWRTGQVMLRGWISYLAANEITNAGEDVSSSLEYVWAVNLQTHSQLVAPNKPTDKSYASLYNW